MTEAPRIKVKRDGPRGWHWIAAHHFDPAIHERVEEPAPAPASPPEAPTEQPTGRARRRTAAAPNQEP